uniref:Movement protein BC1 n=1 Tax=Citrus chlorotic dwarf associated virus TaxID=1202142 RepID=A0A2U8U5B9_9GEMI|nr:movement protein [Citrus chlorotic dwarf associated virus]
MDGQDLVLQDYHSTRRIEYPLSDEWQQIKLAFPSMKEISWHKLRGQCMKIDHCQIRYDPQVPANAEGNVLVVVHDRRMEADKSMQAEYTFPIRCGIELNYYSCSYFSLKDPVPWCVYYRVVNSTVLKGSHFCQFKARVKLSAAKSSSPIGFRGPSVKIFNKAFNEDQVDFMHVGIPKSERVLCRSNSVLTTRPRLNLEAGESWASKSILSGEGGSEVGDSGPYRGLAQLGPDAIDPGDSASNLGDPKSVADEVIRRLNSSVIGMDLNSSKFAEIIGDAVLKGSVINSRDNQASTSNANDYKKKSLA